MRTSTTARSGACSPTSASSVSASPARPTTSWPASSSSPARPSRSSTVSSAITTRTGAPPRSACRRRPGCRAPACRPGRRRGRPSPPARCPRPAPRRRPRRRPRRGVGSRASAGLHRHARRRAVLDRVGERLAGDVVGDGLDLRRRAIALASSSTGTAAARARSSSAAVRPSSSRGGRRPAAIVRRSPIVAATSSTAASNAGREDLRLSGQRALQPAQHDPERHEPLLRAVVQVALEPPALLVAGLRDPRARRLDLGELEAQLDPQAAELHRHRRGVEHRRAARRAAAASAGSWSSTPTSRWSCPIARAGAAVVGQRVEDVAVAVRVRAGLGEAEDHLGARVVERDRERRADVLRLAAPVADVVEEVAQQPHRLDAPAREAPVDGGLQAVAQRAERERRRERPGGRGERRAARELPGEQRDERVRAREQRGEHAVDERAVEEAVDLVQAVPRHRDRDRDREPRVDEHQHEQVGRRELADEQAHERGPAEPQRRQQRAVGQPQDLPAPLAAARPVARAQRQRAAEQREQQAEPADPEHRARGSRGRRRPSSGLRHVAAGTVERRLQREQQPAPGGRRERERGREPPARRRQAPVREQVGERERPQEQHDPLLRGRRAPTRRRRSAGRRRAPGSPRRTAAITSATDSAPASRIHATRVPGRRSRRTSPTHAGAPTPTTSGRPAQALGASGIARPAATAMTTAATTLAASAAAAMAQASGRVSTRHARDPPPSGRTAPRC